MIRTQPNAARLTVARAAVALALLAGCLAPAAGAAPDMVATPVAATEQGSMRLGPALVTLEATETAIPEGGAFAYRAAVRTGEPAEFVQLRTQLFMPDSRKLIYQKTFIDPAPKSGVVAFEFARTIDDIGLEAGAYPLELSVRFVAGGKTYEGAIPATLLVYDAEKSPLQVAVVARVSALPLTGPDGALVADPAESTRARDDVNALCEYVLDEPSARLTLALSPMMLEDWRRVSKGYGYEGPGGSVEVSAESRVPRDYAAALDRVQAAAATGRLELLSMGYSDPNLAELESARLLEDIPGHYELGVSTAFAAAESAVSTGTAPAGGSMSEAGGKALTASGLEYTVVRSKFARAGSQSATPGAYRARGSALRALVSDDAAARALTSSSTADVVRHAYEHHLETSGAPFPVSVAVGPGGASSEAVIAFAKTVESAPWADISLARDVATANKPARVRLAAAVANDRAPAGYWASITEARRWTRALTFAIGADADEAASAERDSLTAEGSAWAGAGGQWQDAERSLDYARSADRTAHDILDKIAMSAKPVTLAGTKGEVPITIANRTGRPIRVRLVTLPSEGVRLGTRSSRQLVLRPQENFVEVPVDLRGGLSGSLQVRLLADKVELAETRVELKASIIDKLAMLGGIVLVLVALLAFIVTKVRAAENRDAGVPDDGGRYT